MGGRMILISPRTGALLLIALQASLLVGAKTVAGDFCSTLPNSVAEIMPECFAGTGVDELLSFFKQVDADGDGEIEQAEASKYMEMHGGGGGDYDKSDDSGAGDQLHSVKEAFDYGGTTISSSELNSHLEHMLTGERVAEWLTHGLRLPQYSAAFRENSIDGLDFPALISDNRNALADDLGVQSPLHRKKIHTALFRQIFGLGRVPGTPLALECKTTPCGSVELQWDPPADLGVPPVHKYLVQRRVMGTRAAAWTLVGDPKADALIDETLVVGVGYVYRVQSWGGHGASDWAVVEGCGTNVAVDEGCSTEGWDYDVATSRWQGDVSSTGGDKQGRMGYLWRGLAVGMALLVGILSRNTFFLDLFFRIMSRVQGKFVEMVVHMYTECEGSRYWILRRIPGTLQTCSRAVEAVTHQLQSALGPRVAAIAGDPVAQSEGTGSEFGTAPEVSVGPTSGLPTAFSVSEDLLPRAGSGAGGGASLSRLDAGLTFPKATSVSSQASEGIGLPKSGSGKSEGGLGRSLPMSGRLRSERSGRQMSGTLAGSGSEGGASSVFSSTRSTGVDGDGDVVGVGVGDADGDGKMEDETAVLSVDTMPKATKSKGRCNYDDCKVRFDRWRSASDWYNANHKHYCKGCQSAYCQKHTRFANHEGLTRCALQTQCMCSTCFEDLLPEDQKELDKRNKIKST